MTAIVPNLWAARAKALIAVVLLAAVFGAGLWPGLQERDDSIAAIRLDQVTQHAEASEAARATEHRHLNAFAAIDTTYQGNLLYAKELGASVTAGLHAGSLRLSPTWRCPSRPTVVSTTIAGTGRPDGQDRRGEESAGRIVGEVARLQAQRDRLIDLLKSEREEGGTP